jgi:hypothetical protein
MSNNVGWRIRHSALQVAYLLAIQAALFAKGAFGKGTPSITIDHNTRRIEVHEALVDSVASADAVPANLKSISGGTGRTVWRLNADDLGRLDPLVGSLTGHAIIAGECGFDLWDGVRATVAAAGANLVLSFDIVAQSDQKALLGFGCTGEAVVQCNGRIVFATGGTKELVRTQSLIEISLSAGKNRLIVLCHKPEGWDIPPEQPLRNQWMISMEVYGDESSAWIAFRSRNMHLMDTPIVGAQNDIIVQATTSERVTARLYDREGTELSRGVITGSGRVIWDNLIDKMPFFGYLMVGSEDAEPVLITGNKALDEIIPAMISLDSIACSDAWKKRIVHLLRPEFASSRDVWWSRKMTVCVGMATEARKSKVDFHRLCRATWLEFHDYVSSVDGTRQYFRMFRNPRSDSHKNPILIVLPSVTDPVRPFLESAEIASLQHSENLASLADENNIVLLWPGLAEVDYGGDLSRIQVDECLAALKKLLDTEHSPVFVLGFCSSSVAALGFAETRDVDGLILVTPIVERGAHRWMKGLDIDDLSYPSVVLKAEQTNTRLSSLRQTPVLILYDADVPGHGDRVGCRILCEDLVSMGGSLDARWPEPSNDFRWGESARVEEKNLLQWVRLNKDIVSRSRNSPHLTISGDRPDTVKTALLKGFAVDKPADAVLAHWFDQWSARWSSFRGSPWLFSSSERVAHTIVVSCVLVSGEDPLTRGRGFFSGEPQLPEYLQNERPVSEALWGFRLVPGRQMVEVFRTVDACKDLPRVDLLVDGCCTGAVWRLTPKGWVLAQLWL